MKSCTGLWIVAPINRAVDDKSAKSLLGDSFKRQLKYDGTYSAVTFICSKTDDIYITEAVESLHLGTEVGETWDAIEKLEKTTKKLMNRLQELKAEMSWGNENLEHLEGQCEQWEELGNQVSDGCTVYAPSPNASRKRKRKTKSLPSRKNRINAGSDLEDVSDSDCYDSDEEDIQHEDKRDREPLTEEMCKAKMADLKAQKRWSGRAERRSKMISPNFARR
jgi:hypothetical protein